MATKDKPAVIVVGGGLAGLAAAHEAASNGAHVVVVEMQARVGGNSAKATSGITGVNTTTQRAVCTDDTPQRFLEDVKKAAKDGSHDDDVQRILAQGSEEAVPWLCETFGVELSLVARLGGHSCPRAHKGAGPTPPGLDIIHKLTDAMQRNPQIELLANACVEELIVVATQEEGSAAKTVVGVRGHVGGTEPFELRGPVVLATGGYAADFGELLQEAANREGARHPFPRLLTTNGNHATGSGLKLARKFCDACVVGLEDIQLHPTGIVPPSNVRQYSMSLTSFGKPDEDPSHSRGRAPSMPPPSDRHVFLAPEVFRGIGGRLVNHQGKRFCDELLPRDEIVAHMLKQPVPETSGGAKFRHLDLGLLTSCFLVLSSAQSADERVKRYIEFFSAKGLIHRFTDLAELHAHLFAGTDDSVLQNLRESLLQDQTGPDAGPWYVVHVTPALHYCMGGLKATANAGVLDNNGNEIGGLLCAGEVMGTVHGRNRLGGNSLLDCVVFGRIAGKRAAEKLAALGA